MTDAVIEAEIAANLMLGVTLFVVIAVLVWVLREDLDR